MTIGNRNAAMHLNTTQTSRDEGAGEEEDEKPRTLLIGNIPRGVHKREIEELFGDVGPLKRCYLQYPRDDKKKHGSGDTDNTLLCYITYALAEDAMKAQESLGNSKVGGKKIFIKFAKTRSEQIREPLERDPMDMETRNNRRGRNRDDYEDGCKNPNMIPVGGVAPQRPKQPRVKQINKKSRLIIRNLSFRVTEEKMQEYFSSCGQIKDINILKKPDGKLVGCAFVQFSTIPEAAKAVRDLNLKPFLGRPIAIDWALPKKEFQDGAEKEDENEVTDIKSENEDEEEIKPKVEEMEVGEKKLSNPYEHLGLGSNVIKIEDDDETIGGKNRINRKRKIKDEESDDDDDDEDDEEDSEDEDESAKKKPRQSNDVEEGRTLFIRNLDFGVTQEQLKEFFDSYGETNYALLCKDPLTEHPKGTGFVKFKNVDSANKCLTDYNINSHNFKLGNRMFSITLALAREKVGSLAASKEKDAKGVKDKNKIKQDNRNLYLTREGFIRPGSSAVEGVSPTDIHKRAALNSTKKQMLKNLSIFVSTTRLCIHNLPLHFTDKALRKLFKQYSDPEARITEARIMRDLKDIQLGGKGKSKGYGFVSFKEHEHALAALRAVNNNPDIFTLHSRPIVEFSLENKKALQAKEKRQEKSVMNNKQVPSSTSTTLSKKSKWKAKRAAARDQTAPKKTTGPVTSSNNSHTTTEIKKEDNIAYSGLKGKPGVSKLPLMRAKGAKKGKISRKSLKGGSTKKKFQERRMREPQPKPRKNSERPDKSEKIVNKYKNKLDSSGVKAGKKGKWYQDK